MGKEKLMMRESLKSSISSLGDLAGVQEKVRKRAWKAGESNGSEKKGTFEEREIDDA